MRINKKIQGILVTVCWIVIGSGVLVLLLAAVSIKNQKTCTGIDIRIDGVKELYFLDKEDVLKIVSGGGMASPAGRSIGSFNLLELENRLEQNVYIKDAELFFDNNLILHVSVEEREPIARVFTKDNLSFYLDKTGKRLPLHANMIVRLPVFTNYAESGPDVQADSLLKLGIISISNYMAQSEFWMAQVAQVDIVAGNHFDLVPTLGHHLIEFGDGLHCEDKFRRLSLFYQQVLSKTGLDKYSRISVQYDKQVIGTKKEGMPKIDSIQAMKNIRKMIESAMDRPDDSTLLPVSKTEEVAEAEVLKEARSMDTAEHIEKKWEPKPVNRERAKAKAPVQKKPEPSEKKLPKAVMKRME